MFEVKHRHKVSENKRLHGIYHGIKKRCYNKNMPRYKDYGGRGIAMCEEWLDPDNGFDRFVDWAFENGYRDDLTIERVNVDGDYCPDNCTWITLKEQRNNQRSTLWVEYEGKRVRLKEICEEIGVVSYDTAHDRIYKRGWSVKDALTMPSSKSVKSFSQKCREHGINAGTARDRIVKLGWSEERALNTPTVGRGANQRTYA